MALDRIVEQKVIRPTLQGTVAVVAWVVSMLAISPAQGQIGRVSHFIDSCLSVDGPANVDGTPVEIKDCRYVGNRFWNLIAEGDLFRIQILGGKCMVVGDIGPSGLEVIELGPCTGTESLWFRTISGFGDFHNWRHRSSSGPCLKRVNGYLDLGLGSCADLPRGPWFFLPGGPPASVCIPSASRMCLNDGRFAVDVDWVKPDGESGVGEGVPVGTNDSGLFYFFNPTNWEMLVKVLDNCDGPTNRFWVFAAASTTVEYTLTVTDTVSGEVREYFNPQGTRAAAIADIEAFATCDS